MAVTTFKCNSLTPLHLNGLTLTLASLITCSEGLHQSHNDVQNDGWHEWRRWLTSSKHTQLPWQIVIKFHNKLWFTKYSAASIQSSLTIWYKGKLVEYSINKNGARSWCRSLGSQHTGDLVTNLAVGRLSLYYAKSAVTFLAEEHHCSLANTKLYCLVTDEHRCK